ncbi:MAG: homocysteine S-methyltransferase family protein [Eubacteriales bacterium]
MDILNAISSQTPFILDGATGTNLQRAGMPKGVCPEKWILENPEHILKLQYEYYMAGSDAVLAPTFGANSAVLSRHGLDGQATEMNKRLAALTVKARDKTGRGYVIADVSPTGLFLKPYGDASFDRICSIYYEQAKALEDIGIDMFMAETMLSLSEARAALIGIRAASSLPVAVSFTVDAAGKTLSGNTLEACFVTVQSCGAAVVGCNCSTGPDVMLSVLQKAMGYADIPVIAKANAGLPRQVGDQTFFDLSPEDFASSAAKLVENGVSLIGGCCGTTPAHIEAIKHAVSPLKVGYDKRGELMRDNTVLCDEKRVFSLDMDSPLPSPIPCDADLGDNMMDIEDEILHLSLSTPEDAENLLENVFMITTPLALSGENRSVEEALKIYTGRAIISAGTMSDGEITRLQNIYGAVSM